MKNQNIIIISLDEVRPDHLSCYGYQKISTPAIDQIASEGIRFTQCITSADFTPVAMGSVLTGKYPNKHGMRDPYSYITGPSVASILKKYGYVTAGFVGNGLLSARHGYGEGFDFYHEPTEDTKWKDADWSTDEEIFYIGNYWVEEFFKWLKKEHKKNFLVWGHLYETHEGSEHSLLEKGLIKEGKLSEFSYYDAKIKMADDNLVNLLISTLKELNIYDNTIIVIMSDHGTNLGEHPAKPLPWRAGNIKYPQHVTMYDCDLKVAMIIKGKDLPKGKVITNMVRSIDLVPTLLSLEGLSVIEYDFDGQNMLPLINNDDSIFINEVYSEDLFEIRGEGAFQSLRSNNFKFIRNLTLGEEEYYDLINDPQEQNNIIKKIDKRKLVDIRKKLNEFLKNEVSSKNRFTKKEKEEIDKRLRGLGYIQ